MKNLLKSIFFLTILATLIGCEENDKSPLPVTQDGSFVTLEFDNLILDVTALETTAVVGTLKAPVANVASYDVEVAWTNEAGVTADYVPVYSTTSFPAELNISLSDIAAAYGADLSEFGAGNRFDFTATSTSTDGRVTTFSDLNGDLQAETGQLQSYRYTSFISCPFSVDEAVGTYTFTNCGFAGAPCDGNVFEVVAGDEPNSVTLINPYASSPLNSGDDPFEITIVVDPATGIGSIAQQRAFSTLEYCCGGFEDTEVDADSGFYFSCTGTLLFTVGTTVPQTGTGALFTFGNRAFEAQKN